MTGGKPITWTEELLKKAIYGVLHVSRMGRTVAYRLTPKQREKFETAKRNGYLYRTAEKDAAIGNAFWTWAEIHKLAVVTIDPRRKYASVACDMLVAPCRLDAQAMRAIDALRTSDRRGCYDQGRYHVGYAHLDRIPLADAERVAAAVYSIAMDCIARAGGHAG